MAFHGTEVTWKEAATLRVGLLGCAAQGNFRICPDVLRCGALPRSVLLRGQPCALILCRTLPTDNQAVLFTLQSWQCHAGAAVAAAAVTDRGMGPGAPAPRVYASTVGRT